MVNLYVVGVILALAGGIANNSGALLQKFAINKIPKEEREKGYFKKLFKSVPWIIGLLLIVGASGALITFAQYFIGGALIPGLMAVGMIVLTIGAVKLLGEKLKLAEYIGIAIMIIGIVFIGLSALEITNEDVSVNINDTNYLIRLGIYSIVFLILWIGSRILGKKLEKGKTIFLTLASSFPFALANAWMQPLMVLINEFINKNYSTLNIILLIISVLIVSVINVLGIGHLQDAFKHGDASMVYPIGQIPQQIAPIIIFYGIYLKSSPKGYSLYFLLVGIILICVAGFLLGRRQGQLETMDDSNDEIKDQSIEESNNLESDSIQDEDEVNNKCK
ncbi:MAG: DMT family transporter [Candidatus Heimdallarchaeota archaeon]